MRWNGYKIRQIPFLLVLVVLTLQNCQLRSYHFDLTGH